MENLNNTIEAILFALGREIRSNIICTWKRN